MASPTLPCELEECGYVIQRDGGMPLWVAVELLGMHQLDHVPHVRQPVQQEKLAIKPVHTASQPVQQEKVAIQPVDTPQQVKQEACREVGSIKAPTMFSCFVPACEFLTAKEEP